MELTLDAALSSDALWGHAAYLVLILSMMMRTLVWLRILVICSALLAIAYAVVILRDPVSAFWETLLVAVNVVQLIHTHWRSMRARFSADESAFVRRYLGGLDRGQARAVLDAGVWRSLPEGAVLARKGAPVAHLSYLAHGTVAVSENGVGFSTCHAGDFVGEMTTLVGSGATADAVVEEDAVLWQIEADRLRALVGQQDGVARTLDAAFAQNYRQKLIATRGRLTATAARP